MSKRSHEKYRILGWLPALVLAWPLMSAAQVPVDEAGNPIGTATEDIPLLSAAELAELVGPIALYPDDLLAIVLPASTYPLQLVQAGRFLQDLKTDSSLKPDEDWDDSVVALTNYPEVIELLTEDLDKTWRLGEAVVAQQGDVIDAVEAFRDRAYAAGNLQSDSRQTVSQDNGVIEITPVDEDVIYVPYYEPERVVVYQPRPVYHYYPRRYPVYYYPYPSGYAFNHGFFWGVTTAFTVGWFTDSLHVYHHSYYGHPYYGRSYWNRYWYRRPNIHVHNNYYFNGGSHNYHHHGSYWRPHARSTVNHRTQRVTRNRHYPGSRPQSTSSGSHSSRRSTQPTVSSRADIRFRERGNLKPSQIAPNQARTSKSASNRTPSTRTPVTRSPVTRSGKNSKSAIASQPRPEIKFRERTTNKPSRKPQQVASVRPGRSSVKAGTQSRQPRITQQRNSNKGTQSRPSPSRQSPSRSSPPKVSQPRSSQPKVSQPRSSQPKSSRSGKSGSSKSDRSANSRRGSGSRDRR